MPKREPAFESTAEAYLALLKRRGIDWLLANAGTDFAPIIEALVRGRKAGIAMPEAVPIAHETIAVGMAHGFYLVTGRPQAVMVHVNVGTANALMGLINASRDNVPMLFTSGRTPLTERGMLGSRDLPDPLGSGDVRPGGHAARVGQMGLRAARAGSARGRGGPRAGHRHERATRTGLPLLAARGAGQALAEWRLRRRAASQAGQRSPSRPGGHRSRRRYPAPCQAAAHHCGARRSGDLRRAFPLCRADRNPGCAFLACPDGAAHDPSVPRRLRCHAAPGRGRRRRRSRPDGAVAALASFACRRLPRCPDRPRSLVLARTDALLPGRYSLSGPMSQLHWPLSARRSAPHPPRRRKRSQPSLPPSASATRKSCPVRRPVSRPTPGSVAASTGRKARTPSSSVSLAATRRS